LNNSNGCRTLRPALDLLAQVPSLPPGPVVDLGCGAGAVGGALAERFPQARRIGVDKSPAMLAEAAAAGHYDMLQEFDIATWKASVPAALIFSNAALHWLADHARLMPKLAAQLAPGGTLAVQIPGQGGAPSHTLALEIAAQYVSDAPGSFGMDHPVHSPAVYHRLLSPLGRVAAWETTYIQRLDPSRDGHPVRHFTSSTALRPLIAALSDEAVRKFIAAYDAALAEAYPFESDGTVLFPFRRVFFTLTV